MKPDITLILLINHYRNKLNATLRQEASWQEAVLTDLIYAQRYFLREFLICL